MEMVTGNCTALSGDRKCSKATIILKIAVPPSHVLKYQYTACQQQASKITLDKTLSKHKAVCNMCSVQNKNSYP